MSDTGGKFATLTIRFGTTIKYWLGSCSPSGVNLVELPIQLNQTERAKVWTIKVSEKYLLVSCDNQRVLNYTFLESCASKLIHCEEFQFSDQYDRLSDAYRL